MYILYKAILKIQEQLYSQLSHFDITHEHKLRFIFVATYSELWLLKVMKRQCLKIMCPRIILYHRQLVRDKAQAKVTEKQF